MNTITLYETLAKTNRRFDWSDSCVEGKNLTYLDGTLDRYSGIFIFDADDKPNEHKEFKWITYEEAIKMLKWDSNKTAIWELNQGLTRAE